MPRSPDPTVASQEAVDRATEVFRREFAVLRELHDKDLAALRELLSARFITSEQDRDAIHTRIRELTREYEADMARFREEVDRRDLANRELTEQRLADLDRARGQGYEDLGRRLAAGREYLLAQVEISATRMTEKFAAIDDRFTEAKDAIAAAFAAAKEAVAQQNQANTAAIAVSDSHTREQLTALSRVTDASIGALSGKVDDARDRITSIESLTQGIEQAGGRTREEKQLEHGERGLQNSGIQLALFSVAVLVSVIAVIISIVLHH